MREVQHLNRKEFYDLLYIMAGFAVMVPIGIVLLIGYTIGYTIGFVTDPKPYPEARRYGPEDDRRA